MARKRTDTIEAGAQATPEASDNGAPAPATQPNKTEAVREALTTGGKTAIPDVLAYVKDKYGLEVSDSLVSKMKTSLGKKKKKGKPGPKPRQATAEAAPAPAKPARQAGLTPEDLSSLVSIAKKAGGLDKLQAFLAALTRIG